MQVTGQVSPLFLFDNYILRLFGFVSVTPPSERVHFILGEDDQDGLHESHPLFSELEELVCTGESGEQEWRETAR